MALDIVGLLCNLSIDDGELTPSSQVPSGGTMAAAPSALPPQRLNEIMEALHRSILFDEEVKDYHFIVGPADHHGIWRGGLAELGLLNNFLDGNIQSVSVYGTESSSY